MVPRARQRYLPVQPLACEPRLDFSARPGFSTRSAHTGATRFWASVRDPAAARAATVRVSAVRSVLARCREVLGQAIDQTWVSEGLWAPPQPPPRRGPAWAISLR